ncbi:MAG: GGDEF domain-containing protein [Planctomycetes bacterium]|nr:GGDEF domain-containing protein [Planctomycetota bacterium]
MPASDALPTLEAAFRDALRRRNWAVALAGGIAFGVINHELQQRQSAAYVAEQARISAAVLREAPAGGLAEAVDELRATFDRLVAVAELTAAGEVRAVYPDDPSYRAAAAQALQSKGEVVTATAPVLGVLQPVGALAVPLDGPQSLVPRQVVVLLRSDSSLEASLWAAGAGAMSVWLALAVAAATLRRWCDRRIAAPLQWLSDPVRRVAGNWGGDPAEQDGAAQSTRQLRELAAAEEQLRTLAHDLALASARAARVERDAQWQLREREAGFDRQLRRAREQATIDPLTKLRNRAFLDRELESLIAAQRARMEDLAVVMIDVDHFKHHNDTQGHQAGDEVLAFIGELLRGATRPMDHAIRYGGDEFLLVLPGAGGQQAGEVAERIIRLFKQYTSTLGTERPPSMSAGVASLKTASAVTAAELLARADEALYRAKKLGRNSVAPCAA